MACKWMWDFGISIGTTTYNSGGWEVGDTVNVDTQSVLNLQTPTGTLTPGDVHTCRITSSGNYIKTPVIDEMETADKGWVAWRTTFASGSSFIGAQGTMLLYDGVTGRLTVRPASSGASSAFELYAGGSLVGTTVGTYAIGDTHYFAVKFDFTTNPVQAGLWIDGVEVITFGNGGTGPVNVNQIRFGCGGATVNINTLSYWDELTDTTASDPDLWSRFLTCTSTADDSEWSPFGGAGNLHAGLSDGNSGTGAETTTDPSDIEFLVQDRDDVLSGWVPDPLFVQATILASADVMTSTDLTLKDASGTAKTVAYTAGATPDFYWAGSAVNSSAVAWTGTNLDEAFGFYEVSS